MPFAPASTTPASRSTGRRDGVRSTEAAAATTAVSRVSSREAVCAARSCSSALGDIRENREDRALRGVADRGTGQGRGAKETCSEVSSRAGLLPFQRRCQPSEDLRQDDAAVSPGPLHGPTGHGRGNSGNCRDRAGRSRVPQAIECRTDCQEHVRSRVPIGDGEHVQRVQRLRAGFQPVQRGFEHPKQCDTVSGNPALHRLPSTRQRPLWKVRARPMMTGSLYPRGAVRVKARPRRPPHGGLACALRSPRR